MTAAGQVDVWVVHLRAAPVRPPARRGFLRCVLGLHLDEDPAALRFAAGRNGKPHLVGRALEFSASSSGDLALCAVSREAVGVDVEQVRRDGWQAVARCYLSAGEREAIGRHGPEAFYRAWTRREALVKARGGTLAHALRERRTPHDGLTLHVLDIADGYAASLAVRHGRPSVRVREWSPRPVQAVPAGVAAEASCASAPRAILPELVRGSPSTGRSTLGTL